jgi:hypothetical protein
MGWLLQHYLNSRLVFVRLPARQLATTNALQPPWRTRLVIRGRGTCLLSTYSLLTLSKKQVLRRVWLKVEDYSKMKRRAVCDLIYGKYGAIMGVLRFV